MVVVHTCEIEIELTLRRLDLSEIITVCIGIDKKEYFTHENIASKSSRYVKAALSRQWEESRARRIQLPEVDIRPFEGYSHWLYTNTILLTTNGPPAMYELVENYILGDYLDDSAFRRAVLEHMLCIRFEQGTMPCGGSIALAWERTTSSSPLRKVLTELVLSRSMSYVADGFKDDDEYPRDFIVDVVWHFTQDQNLIGTSASPSTGRSRETVKKNCRRYIDEGELPATK
jgi:hypothetical protein